MYRSKMYEAEIDLSIFSNKTISQALSEDQDY